MGTNMKKLLVVLLTFTMCFGLLPMTSFAEVEPETTIADKTIMLGTTGISDPVETKGTWPLSGEYIWWMPSDYIWFGNYNSNPIKWRVLDADGTNDEKNGVFLLSECVLGGPVFFENTSYDDGDGQVYKNDWQHSDAQDWCKDFAGETGAEEEISDAFDEKELAAVLATKKLDTAGTFCGIQWEVESCLSNEKVFFLSAEELSRYMCNYRKSPALKAKTSSGGERGYWLRTAYQRPEQYFSAAGVGVVDEYGNLDAGCENDGAWRRGARPAMNLDISQILFTSAAEGGKSSDPGFQQVEAYPGTEGKGEWKLTLKDTSRNFKVTEEFISAPVGGKITLNYTDATTGANEQVSAMIVDSTGKKVLYYGKLKSTTNTGDAFGQLENIQLPTELPPGDYTLEVFSEQCNGDKQTDYASEFDDVQLTIKKLPTFSKTAEIKVDKATVDICKTNVCEKQTLSYSAKLQMGENGAAITKKLADLGMIDKGQTHFEIAIYIDKRVKMHEAATFTMDSGFLTMDVGDSGFKAVNSGTVCTMTGDPANLKENDYDGENYNKYILPMKLREGSITNVKETLILSGLEVTVPNDSNLVDKDLIADGEITGEIVLKPKQEGNQELDPYKLLAQGLLGKLSQEYSVLLSPIDADTIEDQEWKDCFGSDVDAAAEHLGTLMETFKIEAGEVKTLVTGHDDAVVDLTVEAPVRDEAPASAELTTDNIGCRTGETTWNPAHDPFKASTEYTVTVEITADAGYKLPGTCALNGKPVEISNGKVTFTFPRTESDYVPPSAPSGGTPVSPTYPVSLPSSPTGGSITSDKSKASEGNTVTITAAPEEGYETEKITVTDSNGNPIEVTSLGNNKYSFKMPNSKAKVNAVFKANEPTGTGILNKTDRYAYIIGHPDGLIYPNNPITRAEAATIFFRLLNDNSREMYKTKENPFTDVNKGDWFNTAVSTMTRAGILKGYPDGTFRPSSPITRAEFSAIASRFADPGYEGECPFKDVPDNHWAKELITGTAHMGWIKGINSNTFEPERSITRAEAVAVVNRILERASLPEDMLSGMLIWRDNSPGDWYFPDIQTASNSYAYEETDRLVPGTSYCYEKWTEILPVPDWAAYEK